MSIVDKIDIYLEILSIYQRNSLVPRITFQLPYPPDPNQPPNMAKTRQSATKSTGGKAPRKNLATKTIRTADRTHLSTQVTHIQGKDIKEITAMPSPPLSYRLSAQMGTELTSVTVTPGAVTALLGDMAADYMLQNVTSTITSEYARIIGLSDMIHTTRQRHIATPGESSISIARLVLCNGSPAPAKNNNRTYHHDVSVQDSLYAILGSPTVGSSDDQEPSDWVSINLCTLQVTAPDPNNREPLGFSLSHSGEVSIAEHSPFDTHRYIHRWLLDHPNKCLHLAHPGNRPPSTRTARMHMKHYPFIAYSPTGKCLETATVSALQTLTGSRSVTKTGMDRANTSYFRHLPTLSKFFKTQFPRIWELRIVRDLRFATPQNISLDLEAMTTLPPGQFIAQMNGVDPDGDVNNHASHIATNQSPLTGLIYDPAERFAMPLTTYYLKQTLGEGSSISRIRGIRELVQITPSSKVPDILYHPENHKPNRRGSKKRKKNNPNSASSSKTT